MSKYNDISYHVRSIREGIELADVDTNFLLLSENYLYGDFPFDDGREVFEDVYGKRIPSTFHSKYLNKICAIKSSLYDSEKAAFNLPPEVDPIVLFTKDRTVKYFKKLVRHYFLRKYFQRVLGRVLGQGKCSVNYVDYVKKMSLEEFGKLLIVFSFHEAKHKKWTEDIQREILERLQKSGLIDDSCDSPSERLLEETFVTTEELRLCKRRPDLEPYITTGLNSNFNPLHVHAYQLAQKLIGS